MLERIENAKSQGDSVGGVAEVIVYDMIKGIGDNLFDGLENKIAYSLFSVPAVKGVEFGSGFDGVERLASLSLVSFSLSNSEKGWSFLSEKSEKGEYAINTTLNPNDVLDGAITLKRGGGAYNERYSKAITINMQIYRGFPL